MRVPVRPLILMGMAAVILVAPRELPRQENQDQAGAAVEILPPKSTPATPAKEFYELKISLEELRRQMNQLRIDVEAYRSREMTPEVYQNILRRLTPPPMTHEVILTNGTVVRGNIISENLDQLTLETTLGNLTLDKSNIRSIDEITNLNPKVEFLGDAKEEIHEEYRIYTGAIKNTGINRGDFVRIIFKLWNSQAQLVATDSAFVNGNRRVYLSGVVSDTVLDPGQEGSYHVRINVSTDRPVSYITREIHWERLD